MKHSLTPILLSLGLLTTYSQNTFGSTHFDDVADTSWYAPYVNRMASEGFIDGMGDGNFYPDHPLTLAEFSTMIANGFYGNTLLMEQQESVDTWWAWYMNACGLRGGLVNTPAEPYIGESGTWDDTPNQPISRYHMAQMIHNLLIDRGIPPLSSDEIAVVQTILTDAIPDQFADAVATAYYYGFIQGREDKSFDGDATLTRAEASAVLDSLVHSYFVDTESLEDARNQEDSQDDVLQLPDDSFEDLEEEFDANADDEVDSDAETDDEVDSDAESDDEVDSDTEADDEVDSDEDADDEVDSNAEADEDNFSNTHDEEEYEESLPSQEELGTWVTNTILGASAPNAYVYNDGIYVKNSSTSQTVTVDDLATRSELQLEVGIEAPQILIYHSHATESFMPTPTAQYTQSGYYRSTDNENNVTKVGAAMAKIFEDAGFVVIHDTTLHDYPDYNSSYTNSKVTVDQYLEEYPSIVLALDVHRDGLESDGVPIQLVSQQGEDTIAQVMLFVAAQTTTRLHPNWRENFALALTLQESLLQYGDFARPITVSPGNATLYNQIQGTGHLLLEVGNHGNTLEQAIAAGELFAKTTALTLGGSFEEAEEEEELEDLDEEEDLDEWQPSVRV